MSHTSDTSLHEQLQAHKTELFSLRMSGDSAAIAEALLDLARLQGILEQHQDARASYQEALPLFQKAKNLPGEAECLRGIGIVCAHLAEVRGALVHLSNAAGVYRDAKELGGEALCHAAAAEVVRATGDLEGAEAGLASALELFRKAHDHVREARVLLDLGDVRMERERYDEALASYLEALPIAREELPALVPQLLLHLAEAAGFSNRHAEARDAAQEAATFFQREGDVSNEARGRWDLGMAHFFLAEYAEAQTAFERTHELFEQLGDLEGVQRVRSALATVGKKRATSG